jgi:hypothetical protein
MSTTARDYRDIALDLIFEVNRDARFTERKRRLMNVLIDQSIAVGRPVAAFDTLTDLAFLAGLDPKHIKDPLRELEQIGIIHAQGKATFTISPEPSHWRKRPQTRNLDGIDREARLLRTHLRQLDWENPEQAELLRKERELADAYAETRLEVLARARSSPSMEVSPAAPVSGAAGASGSRAEEVPKSGTPVNNQYQNRVLEVPKSGTAVNNFGADSSECLACNSPPACDLREQNASNRAVPKSGTPASPYKSYKGFKSLLSLQALDFKGTKGRGVRVPPVHPRAREAAAPSRAEGAFMRELREVFSPLDMANNGGRWRMLFRENPSACRRVLSEIKVALREGRIIPNRGGWMFHLYQRWTGKIID